MKKLTWFCSLSVAAALACGGGQSKGPEPGPANPGDTATTAPSADLIDRDLFFGNPDKVGPQLSPDGTQISYLAPVDGVLNVWVGPIDDLSKAKPVTEDKTRPVRRYFWAYTGKHILYMQDKGGDENYHVFAVDLTSGKTTDLTPLEGVRAEIQAVSQNHPEHIVVGLNDRVKMYHDVYKLNIKTGKRQLLAKNDGYLGFHIDHDYKVRFATKMDDDGGSTIYQVTRNGKKFKKYIKVPFEDSLSTQIGGFSKDNKTVFMLDSRGRNTAAAVSLDIKSRDARVLAENELADAGGAIVHPTEYTIQAVSFNYERKTWKVLDPSIQPDLDKLSALSDGELSVVDRTLDDKKWLVSFLDDDGPVRYYLWDRDKQAEKFLFVHRKELEGLELAKMHPVVVDSRDGFKLVNYLTLPLDSDPEGDGTPTSALPTVLMVHGGPWARDSWGFDGWAQLLANRGYAVLSVNFRGSTGFGKKFLNAGNGEWAGKMHDDLIDSVNWAVESGVAQKDKVCIMGGSYGGYATLVGLTFTPKTFACGVDIVGPSNILTLLSTIPPYWKPFVAVFKTRVGDWTTEEGKKELLDRSPLSHVEKIERPLLIGQGANDPRVKQAESDQIVAAMKEKNIPVSYVLFPDEGHGFARTENRLAFFAVAEAFLAEHLGGAAQPLKASDFDGSSIKVPAGKDGVPGLADALK